jgi:hypothetical protein
LTKDGVDNYSEILALNFEIGRLVSGIGRLAGDHDYRSENQPYHFQLASHFYAQLKLHTLMVSPRIENIGK